MKDESPNPFKRGPGFFKRKLTFNLKNKILYSSVAVVLIVSAAIALVARYILITSLQRELELRGLGIAQSVADRSTGLILTLDKPNLTSLVFEAVLVGERKALVSYMYILDTDQDVLASTFIVPFPEHLKTANFIPPGAQQSIMSLDVLGDAVYDIAVPVKEGIYDVGSVHVGLSQVHIDQIVAKLRMIFLGFIGGIVVVMFVIADRLSRTITRPIAKLIRLTDEVSRDNLDVSFDLSEGRGLGALIGCRKSDCPGKKGSMKQPGLFCRTCLLFAEEEGDEVSQLAESFHNMVFHIREYRDQLKKSQLKYRSLFHSGPDPIFVLEAKDFRILDANPMAAEVYGFSRKELVGMTFDKLAPELVHDALSHFQEDTEDSLTGCVFHPKALSRRKSGDPFMVNIHACGTIYEDKPALIISAVDITDMVEKDAQLVQAAKMKTLGEMSAGMAHELNQPLNAIKIGSEYLNLVSERGGDVPAAKLNKVTREISEQVDRAAEIISSLREFGRKADLTKERLDLNRPIKGVLNILRRQMELENITFDLQLDEEPPHIVAHNNRVEQVLFNLVTNARDAINMKEPGAEEKPERKITIKTYAKGGRAYIAVKDSGHGISPEAAKRIFEPFFTTKETGKGMGLGLAISHGIVRDYSGHIEVDGNPGLGAEFRLSFPAA